MRARLGNLLAGALAALLVATPAGATPLDELQAAAKRPPKDAAEALELGKKLRRAGLFNDATKVLRSTYGRAQSGSLAEQVRLEATRSLIAAGQQKAALRECDSLKKVSKSKQEVCIAEVQLLWRRASLALPAAVRALELAPGDYDALVAKGRAEHQMGEPRDAEATLRVATSREPGRHEALRHLGELLHGSGRKSEGVATLRKAQKLASDEPELLLMLAEKLPPGSESTTLLEQAISIRPEYGAAHARLGQVLEAVGKSLDAERSLRKAVAINPKDADWRAALARVLLGKGDTEAAMKEAEAALKLVQNHGAAKLVQADALAKRGEIDLAIETYEAAYGLTRTEPTALVHGARACLERKRPTTAQAFADRATQSFPKWGPGWEIAGDIALAANDKPAARDAYKKALAGDGPVDRAALRKKLAAVK